MVRALNLLTIPNTETLRALARHFKVSVSPYEKHLHGLKANQDLLVANWQGEGTEAYVQSNGRLLSGGAVHVEQMQEAANILESTATLLDEGSRAQNAAEMLWKEAKTLEIAGQFVAAAPIEASAHAAQAAALATLESARISFNTRFAALTATIPNTLGMTDKGFDNYEVTGGYEKTLSSGSLTLPATSSATPSSKEVHLDAPKSTLIQTPPAASKGGQDVGNPSEPTDTDLASENVTFLLAEASLFNAGTLHHEPENAGEISDSTAIFEQYITALAQNPQAGTSKGPRITQPLNITGVMYSLLPQNPLAQALQSTPEGAKALSDEQTLKVSLILVPGQGSEYHPGSNTAYLGADLPFAQLQEKYIHELKHAQDALTNGVIDPRNIDTSEEYARSMLNKEAEAEAPAIRHHLRSNAYIPSNALEETYWDAYKQGLDAAQTSHPSGIPEQWHEAGLSQAKEALVTALKGETVTISTGNIGYEEYYKIQHQRALDGQTTTVINPAPGDPPGSQQITLASTDSQGQEEWQLLSRLRYSSDLQTTEEGKRALALQEEHKVLLRGGSMPGAEVKGEASYDEDTNTTYLGLSSNSSRKQRDAAFVQAMTYVRIAHDSAYANTPSGQNQQAIQRVERPLWPRSYATAQEYTQARLWQDVLAREESMNYALRLEQEEQKAWEAQKALDLKKFIGLQELYELQEKKWESNLVLLEHQRVYIEALNEAALKKYAHLSHMNERILKAREDARNALFAFLSTERVTLTSEDMDSEASMMRSNYYRRYWNIKNQEDFIGDIYAIPRKESRIPLFTSYSIDQVKRTIDEIDEEREIPRKTYKFAKITEETSIGIASIGESRDNSAANSPLIPRKTVQQTEGAKIAKTTDLGISSARKHTRSNPGKYTWEAKGEKTKVTTITSTKLPEVTQPSTAGFFAAPESENVVTSFYQGIKRGYDKLVSKIEGIPTKTDKMGKNVPGDRERYASLMLNRLAFLTFIQEKRFLNGDPKYLQNQLKQMRTLDSPDGTSYQSFLSKLFRALNAPLASSELADELGQVPCLKNDLFAVHQLERQYPEVKIPNKAYASLFRSFAQYHWHLDEDFEPLGTDIDPETFGFGFEQFASQKEMGAYYTSKDVTEYIGNKAILPSLFDKLAESLAESSPDVLSPDGPVLSLLQKNFADYTYGIEAKREAKEKIEGISDLITYNLDSGKLAEDFITNCSRPDVLLAFYTSLTATTVLDPTCGTGAFLFAASRVLSPLYLACLTRMQVLADTYDQLALRGELPEQQVEQLKDMRKILQQRGNVPLRYFILKSIITRNLYGVDLMEGAVETCKLSLSLKLLAQVDNPEDWEGEDALSTDLLNVFAGNALVETDFDWKKKFPQVMRHGKFDVIIGNPPYVVYNAEQFAATAGYTLSQQSFQTLDCRNLYAYVVEKSRRELLAPTGYMGMIIPLAAFSTSTMTPLLDRFYRWFPKTWVSFFHALPSSLFDGGKGAKIPTAIFLGKTTGEPQRFSTTLIKWRAPERDQLFSRLVYCPVTVDRDPHNNYYYPKFGAPIENSIMQKIRRHKRVGKYLTTQTAGQEEVQKIWYRNAGGESWKIFLNYAWPLSSTTNRELSVLPSLDHERDIFVALFNSTLFFWYYTATTNAFDVSTYALLGFRFSYPEEDAIFEGDTTILQALRSCTTRLMADYKENSRNGVRRDKEVYTVYAAQSKDIIDEIDTILAKHYHLTDQERDFILNYHSEFRKKADLEDEAALSGSASLATRRNTDDRATVGAKNITKTILSKLATVSLPWQRKDTRAKQRPTKEPEFEQVMTDSSESGQALGGDSQLSHRQEAAAVNPVAVVEDKKRLAKLRGELEKAENDIQAAEESFSLNAQRTMKLRSHASKLANDVRALERKIGSPSESSPLIASQRIETSAGSLRDIQGEVSEAEPVLSTATESQEPQKRKKRIIIESSSSEAESRVKLRSLRRVKRKSSSNLRLLRQKAG